MVAHNRMDSKVGEKRGVGDTRVKEVRALIEANKYPETDAENALGVATDRMLKDDVLGLREPRAAA